MSKKFNILFFLTICLLSINVSGQDKILFINGKVLEGKLIEKTNYEFTFKSKSDKQFIIDKYRVFSYTQNNKETIVYEYDTLALNFLKVPEMKKFVYGERDAQQTFKPRFTNALGYAIGGAAGYLMHRDQSFVYFPAPILYTALTLPFGTRVRQEKIKDKRYIKENEYLRGYDRIATSKRTQSALKSSLAGMGIGFLIGIITNSSKE